MGCARKLRSVSFKVSKRHQQDRQALMCQPDRHGFNYRSSNAPASGFKPITLEAPLKSVVTLGSKTPLSTAALVGVNRYQVRLFLQLTLIAGKQTPSSGGLSQDQIQTKRRPTSSPINEFQLERSVRYTHVTSFSYSSSISFTSLAAENSASI